MKHWDTGSSRWVIQPSDFKLKRGWFLEWHRNTPNAVFEAIGRGYEPVPDGECRVPVRRSGWVLMMGKKKKIREPYAACV